MRATAGTSRLTSSGPEAESLNDLNGLARCGPAYIGGEGTDPETEQQSELFPSAEESQ
jgi:hypothetical protein